MLTFISTTFNPGLVEYKWLPRPHAGSRGTDKEENGGNRKVKARVRKYAILLPLKAICAVLLLLSFSMSGAACSVWGTNVVRISGSTTLLPLAQEGADRFMDMYGDKTVLVQGGGSSVGIAQVKEGIVDIANSSRELKPEEDDGRLVDHPIALDVIVIVVNPGVTVDKLSREQVKDIFTGKVSNWSEVGGADAPILVVVRDMASGTREMFDKEALEDEDVARSAIESNSNGIVRETVAATPNSVGYVSIGYINESIKAVDYDGVAPSIDNAKDGSYVLSRYLHMFTYGETTGTAQEFIDYMLSEEFQLGVVAQEYIPVFGLKDE
jgi:phosphate transport system substrate-binding protein